MTKRKSYRLSAQFHVVITPSLTEVVGMEFPLDVSAEGPGRSGWLLPDKEIGLAPLTVLQHHQQRWPKTTTVLAPRAWRRIKVWRLLVMSLYHLAWLRHRPTQRGATPIRTKMIF
jgi:hypothetical protein